MDQFCHSCAGPLSNPELRGASEKYCKYCSDDKGKLKSRSEVQRGIVEWFKMWQPNVDDVKAMARPADYMKAMPAWTN
jgi:hypothetical protein